MQRSDNWRIISIVDGATVPNKRNIIRKERCFIMSQSLNKQRKDILQRLQTELSQASEYFNQAFSGNASFNQQDSCLHELIELLTSIQQSAMEMRQINSDIVMQRKIQAKRNQMVALTQSYQTLQKAMSNINNILDGNEDDNLLVDNSNSHVSVPKIDTDKINEESGNFSEPVATPAADSVSANREGKSDDNPKVDNRPKFVDAKAGVQLHDQMSQIEDKDETQEQPEHASRPQHQEPTERAEVASDSPKSASAVEDLSQSNAAWSDEDEYRSHEKHAKERLAHSRQVNQANGIAVKWPGHDHFVNKAGEIADDEVREIRDVTPKNTDEENIDKILNDNLKNL